MLMEVREVQSPQPGGLLEGWDERLRVTLECAPVGIAHLDAHGDWQLLNGRLCEMLGFDRGELLAARLEDVLELDLHDASGPADGPGSGPIERCCARGNGDVGWLRVTVSSVGDSRAHPTYYVVVVEDIAAEKALNGTLGVAAHELRLPLSHIKGFISTLRRSDKNLGSNTRREFLADAEHEADRLDDLIQDLLEQSTGREHERSPRTTIHPCGLVRTTIARLRPMMGDRQVRVDVPADLPTLQVEVPAMERVLANLLLNANKYSPERVPIDVTAGEVGDYLELRVDDRGPGVPAQEAERIFDPFYRGADHAQDDAQAGHGLGLAICRSIVTTHGGRIWVSERPSGGARFTVALPVRSQTARESDRSAFRECVSRPNHRWRRTPGARPIQTTT